MLVNLLPFHDHHIFIIRLNYSQTDAAYWFPIHSVTGENGNRADCDDDNGCGYTC